MFGMQLSKTVCASLACTFTAYFNSADVLPLTHSLTLSITLARSLSFTHSHSLSLKLTHAHCVNGSLAPSLTHFHSISVSFAHSLTRSFTHSHSPIHPLIHSLTHLPTHPLIHSLTHSLPPSLTAMSVTLVNRHLQHTQIHSCLPMSQQSMQHHGSTMLICWCAAVDHLSVPAGQ